MQCIYNFYCQTHLPGRVVWGTGLIDFCITEWRLPYRSRPPLSSHGLIGRICFPLAGTTLSTVFSRRRWRLADVDSILSWPRTGSLFDALRRSGLTAARAFNNSNQYSVFSWKSLVDSAQQSRYGTEQIHEEVFSLPNSHKGSVQSNDMHAL